MLIAIKTARRKQTGALSVKFAQEILQAIYLPVHIIYIKKIHFLSYDCC